MRLTCCEPRRGRTPSGISWIHADGCTLDPKQIVVPPPGVASPAHTPRTRNLSRNHRLETARTGLHIVSDWHYGEVVAPIHPACKDAADDGGTPCSVCSWKLGLENEGAAYIEANLDGGVA